MIISGCERPEVLIYDTKRCKEGLRSKFCSKYKRWDVIKEIEENWGYHNYLYLHVATSLIVTFYTP